MSANYYTADYTFNIHGKKLKRKQLVDLILSMLKEQPMTIPMMQKELGMEMQQLRNFHRWMVVNDFIMNTGKKKGDYFLYKVYRECLLAELLYPSPKEIHSQFKIKGVTRKKAEDFKSRSSGTQRNAFGYSNHHLNSVYYANGE